MKAFVLAAGKGTRLQPLTNNLPKPLIRIHDRSMIDYTFGYLKKYGVTDVVINIHHHAQIMKDHILKEKHANGLNITFSDESKELLDTGGGLKKASSFFTKEDHFIMVASDVFTNLPLNHMIKWHLENKNLVTLAVKTRETSRSLLLDDTFQLQGWKDNRTGEEKHVLQKIAYTRKVGFSGIHVISTEIFNHFPQENVFSIIPFYLRLAAQQSVRGYLHDDYDWMEFGRLDNFETEAKEKKLLQMVTW